MTRNDNGKEYTLLVVGGTAIPTNISASRTYLQSVERMYRASREVGAAGTLDPHGIIDGGNQHMADIRARGSRTPNSYILGNEKLLRTLAIMRECGAAQVAQGDATSFDPVWRVTKMEFEADSPAPGKLAARLTSGWGAVAGQQVTFNVKPSGGACVATTDASGLASCPGRECGRAEDACGPLFTRSAASMRIAEAMRCRSGGGSCRRAIALRH